MAARRPQDLVFTLFGDFLLHRPGPVWVGSLITLLRTLRLSEGAARTVLSRMVGKGWLAAARRGRHSFYDLTPRGRRLLEAGESRIYHPPRDKPWDGRWYLIAYSIPENRRSIRDGLRVRLSWLGCGSLGNGLWICPHDVRVPLEEIADSLRIRDNLELFRAEHTGFSDVQRLVAHCWDLPAINARYEAFIDRYWPEYEASRSKLEGGRLSPEECFVRRFALVHEYREFPLIDPYLPRSLLPREWAGDCAAGLFTAFHDLLMPLADRYVDEALEHTPQELRTLPAAGRSRAGAAIGG
ncbi:MAG: PaaX family transcriptional regulator C-terminal domain-containing protein [Gemmatimonadota bacterium]